LFWNDNCNETDDNAVCTDTNISDDQQNIIRQDYNISRMSKRHKKPSVTRNYYFYGKKIILHEIH
jgi:hypothetical protein